MIKRRLPFALTIGVLAAGLGLISAAGVLADKKPRPKSSGLKKTAPVSVAKAKSKTKSKAKSKAPESAVAVAPPTSGHSVAYEFVGYIKTSGGQLAKLWHSREVPVQPEAQYRYVGRMKFDDWVYVWVEAQGDEALTADVISQVASEAGLDDQPLLPPEQQQDPNAQPPDVFPDGGQGIVEVSPEEAQAAGQVVEQNLTEEPNPAAAQPLLQRTFQPQLQPQPQPAPPVPNGKPQ
jgi:hypothetical protein